MAKVNDVAGPEEQLPDKLNLYSIGKLEYLLGFPREHVRVLALNAGGEYDPYIQYKKPRPFQRVALSRKPRTIDNPSESLKRVQRSINRHLLVPLAYPYYMCGGIRGKGVLDNVAMHMGQTTLVTLDIRSFFPSVRHQLVYQVWRDLLNCSPRVSELLTKLTTFERHLPQGAPTSTLLANLVLFMVDGPIREKCQCEGITYSTWVDDLAFSGENARLVIQTAVRALRDGGFAVSRSKLKIAGPRERKVLNGILLGQFPTVEPKRLAWIRSGIHKLASGCVAESSIPKYLRSLEGKINHVSGIVPSKGRKLARALEAARELSFRGRQ